MTTLPTTVPEGTALPYAMPEGEPLAPPTAGDVLRMLRRRQVLIVVLSILFSALTVGGFAAWWLYLPGYTSECLIECVSNIPDTGLTAEQERLRADEHERFVRTQATLLASPTILSEALKVNAVRETDWFKRVLAWKDEPLIELNEDLSVSPVRGTNFIRVAIECRKREDPRVIVNEVVNQWYHDVRQRSAEAFASENLVAGQNELQDLDRQIAVDRQRLKELAQRMPAGAIKNPAGNITAQQVQQAAEIVAALELELAQLEQYRSIYNDPEGLAVTAEDRAMVELDPQIAELSRAQFLLEQQRAADSKKYGAGHAVLRQLDAQIEATAGMLDQARLEKLQQRRADMREAVNTAYNNTRYALLQAREKLAKDEAAQQDQDRLLFDYLALESKIETDLKYREELAEWVRGLSRVKTQRTAIKVNVAQPPMDPLERSSPSLLMIPLGLVFSVLLAGGLGLLLELSDKSVRTPQDIERFLGAAMLGVVPDVDDEEVAIKRVETAMIDAPQSMTAEAFRRIRTNLLFGASADRHRVIMVASPGPDDGKTTVACNLAIAAAQSGRRVLLVDANLRRGGLHRIFEGVKSHGLSQILTGAQTLALCVSESGVAQLDVLGSGPAPPNPVELLDSERFASFLIDARGRYDQVIIDTAPLSVASDGMVIAPRVDGVILVIRANRNTRGLARRAYGLLANVGGHCVGAVLNAARTTRGGYFREQLQTFYRYQSKR
jgi:capsular exopolysaccharide synthesis family protein